MSLTYNGSTAGATLSNPPVLMESAIGGHVNYATTGASASTGFGDLIPNNGAAGAKIWFYSSSNNVTDMAGAASINDGQALGMTWGDIMFGVTATAYSTTPVFWAGVLVTSAASTSFCLSSNVLSSTNQ